MKIPRRGLIAGLGLLATVACGIIAVTNAEAATIPLDQPVTGKATYYNDAGYGACGRSINARTEMLVAVSHTYWTSSNPNNDPLCSGISVQVTYRGTTITVPVEDKCPSCDATHIDLSEPAFARLGNLEQGVLSGLTWKFVRSDGSQPGAGTPSAAQPDGQETGTELTVLLTGYGWWDNTPPGSSEISHPVIHRSAGGTGTYDDPITAAVPYHCDNGCLQWPAGTRFYLPALQRYLIVEDTCGDGGPDSCPDSTGDHLDVWVGGRSLSQSASDACEERITGPTAAILAPAAGLPVTPGDICR